MADKVFVVSSRTDEFSNLINLINEKDPNAYNQDLKSIMENEYQELLRIQQNFEIKYADSPCKDIEQADVEAVNNSLNRFITRFDKYRNDYLQNSQIQDDEIIGKLRGLSYVTHLDLMTLTMIDRTSDKTFAEFAEEYQNFAMDAQLKRAQEEQDAEELLEQQNNLQNMQQPPMQGQFFPQQQFMQPQYNQQAPGQDMNTQPVMPQQNIPQQQYVQPQYNQQVPGQNMNIQQVMPQQNMPQQPQNQQFQQQQLQNQPMQNQYLRQQQMLLQQEMMKTEMMRRQVIQNQNQINQQMLMNNLNQQKMRQQLQQNPQANANNVQNLNAKNRKQALNILPPPVREKSGSLQILTLSHIMNKAGTLIGDAERKNFQMAQQTLAGIVNKIDQYRKSKSQPVPQGLKEELVTDYKKVLGSINICIISNRNKKQPSTELKHLLTLAQTKVKDDLQVIENLKPDKNLYETVKKKSKLGNHYGMAPDRETIVSFYDLHDGGLENTKKLVDNMYKSIDDADPALMLTGSDDYTKMKNSIKAVKNWLKTYQEKKGKFDPERDMDVAPMEFKIKVDKAMKAVKKYLDHKQKDVEDDLKKKINRVEDKGRQKYEQPRIRAALHAYDELMKLAEIGGNNMQDLNRDQAVKQHKENLLSKESKKLFDKEVQSRDLNAPSKKPAGKAKVL